MHHFTLDGLRGYRSRFDDIRLVHELLQEIPWRLGLRPVMPPNLLPYYDGVAPEDAGISAFVLLAGGHLTLHTFSFRECYFADLLYPEPFDGAEIRRTLQGALPCAIQEHSLSLRAGYERLGDISTAPERDFGPHLMLELEGYHPDDLDGLFELFDRFPAEVGMTPIMRPMLLRDRDPSGSPVLSVLTMIAESHIALHVFPEKRLAYFDLFSCRFFDRAVVESRIRALLPAEAASARLIPRGRAYQVLRTERPQEVARARAWLGPQLAKDP